MTGSLAARRKGSCCALRKLPPELDYISEDVYTYIGSGSCGPGPCGAPVCAGLPCEPRGRSAAGACPGWNATAEVRGDRGL